MHINNIQVGLIFAGFK